MILQTQFRNINDLANYAISKKMYVPLVELLRQASLKEQTLEALGLKEMKANSKLSFKTETEAERFLSWIVKVKLGKQFLFPNLAIKND